MVESLSHRLCSVYIGDYVVYSKMIHFCLLSSCLKMVYSNYLSTNPIDVKLSVSIGFVAARVYMHAGSRL